MRLLLVTQDFPPDVGGIQTFSAQLAPRFARRADHFSVVAPQRPGSEEVDGALPFHVHRLAARPDLLVGPATLALPGIARRERIDVAFHAQWQTAPASLAARRLTGYPRRIVVAAHGRELLFNPAAGTPLLGAYDALRRSVVRRADRVQAVSHYTAGLVADLGVPPEKVEVVHNGTDVAFFQPLDAGALRQQLGIGSAPVLLTVSRLVGRKGVDTILRALPSIAQAVPDVQYLVVGDGPDRERLEHLAAGVGIAGRVCFLGRMPYAELPLYYNLCDVFAMPSRNEPPDVEGFGLVFHEANACSKPVIGARSGGIPDAVRDGETGLLVPPGNPEAFATAAIRLLSDPELARRLGAQGLEHVRRHGRWDAVADGIYRVLQRALMAEP